MFYKYASHVWTRCPNKPTLSHGWRIGGGGVACEYVD